MGRPTLSNIAERSSLKNYFGRARLSYDKKSVATAELPRFLSEGWSRTKKKGKRRSEIRRSKSLDRAFEDRVWCLLYRMGFGQLSHGNKCELVHDEENGTTKNQLDAVALDDFAAVVVECKAQEALGPRSSLPKDIQAFS